MNNMDDMDAEDEIPEYNEKPVKRHPPVILPPGSPRPKGYGKEYEHEISNSYATDLGVAGFEVTLWYPGWAPGDSAPMVYRLDRVWVNDDGPDMTGDEVAAWMARYPELAAEVDAAVADKVSDIGDP